jgi:hypothetical protein
LGGQALLALTLLAGIAACARPIGDLGRPKPSYLNDVVYPTIGTARARAAGEPVSTFNETDQETEMHDRVWRFLVSPNGRDWAFDSSVERQRTRIEPGADKKFTIDRYYRTLRTDAYASSRVRYARIREDASADVSTLPATFKSICDVFEVDRQRLVALNALALDPSMAGEVASRKAENDKYIAWFTRALRYRYDSYSYALDHFLVETPHEEAVEADAMLSDMRIFVEAAERGDFCGGAGGMYGGVHDIAPLPGRVLITPRDTNPALPPK